MNQITNTILMVRPKHFGFNPETANNNSFQNNDTTLSSREISDKAIAEFDQFVATLRAAGVRVLVAQDSDSPVKTDAVFPNNWFTTHESGELITYPMFSPIRRTERQGYVLDLIAGQHRIARRISLEDKELEDRFLEGTGSMILDRANRIVYACRSIRTDEGLIDEFCRWMDYEAVIFDAYNEEGIPIYHTNVMMALGTTYVVICLEAVHNEDQLLILNECFERTGKEVISISMDQMNAFAGNMLQVSSEHGEFLTCSRNLFDEKHVRKCLCLGTVVHNTILLQYNWFSTSSVSVISSVRLLVCIRNIFELAF